MRTEDSSSPLCSLPQRPGGRRPVGEGAGRTPAIGRDSTWGARRRRPPAVGNSCFSPGARRGAGSPGWGSGAVAGVELETAGGGLALLLPAPTGQSRKDPWRLGQGHRTVRTGLEGELLGSPKPNTRALRARPRWHDRFESPSGLGAVCKETGSLPDTWGQSDLPPLGVWTLRKRPQVFLAHKSWCCGEPRG